MSTCISYYLQSVRVQRLEPTVLACVNAILQTQTYVTMSMVHVSVSLVGKVSTVIQTSKNALRIPLYVLLRIPNAMRCQGPISASAKQGILKMYLVCAQVGPFRNIIIILIIIE